MVRSSSRLPLSGETDRRTGTYEVARAGPLRLDVGSLDAGQHTFAFSLDVPLSSPPTERCALGSIDYAVVATAIGMAASGKDLIAKEPLVVNAIPSSEGQPPPGLDVHAEGRSDDFGRWELSLKSALLSVGGLIAFSFAPLEQPRSIATMGYEVDLAQTIEFTDSPAENVVTRYPLYRIEVNEKSVGSIALRSADDSAGASSSRHGRARSAAWSRKPRWRRCGSRPSRRSCRVRRPRPRSTSTSRGPRAGPKTTTSCACRPTISCVLPGHAR